MMFFSLFLISAAVLAYEILLMRIFSITQWHHFAYMIISIALLGFGASGTFISLFRRRLQQNFLLFYRSFAMLFAVSIIISYFLSQRNTFNPFEIVWNSRQYLHLMEYYLTLFLPFFFAATCIGLLFTRYTHTIGRVYCYNLIGSGVGVIAAIVCFSLVHPVQVLYAVLGLAMGGFGATFFYVNREGREEPRRKNRNHIFLGILLACLTMMLTWFGMKYDPFRFRAALHISQYKGFSQTRKFPNAAIEAELISPLGVVHAISSPIIRNAPGLSLNYTGEISPQIALFIDSGNAGVITNAGGNLEFLDFLSPSLAYHLRPMSHVLILGAGGGMDVLNALFHQATSVDAVELDPNIIALVRDRFGEFASHLYARPDVRIIRHEARGYIETTPSTYDGIHISLLDSFGSSSAGVHALHENYLYTVEALQQYYAHLTPRGILSITRWVKFPPRDNIKLFATAIEALKGTEVEDISRHFLWIRSWATCTLLVSKTPFTADEIAGARNFCRERAFDVNYFQGISADDANRYNQLPSDEYYHAAQSLLFGDQQKFYKTYPYFIRPARDDSPYFFHFFTWRSFPTLLKTMGKEWIPFIEWGYLVLLATLVQAGILSVCLILLPLFVLPRSTGTKGWRLYTFLYFLCLGLGYLFLEIVFIQKFTLFLATPTYAASVIIATFLISSGLGSLFFETGHRTPDTGHRKLAIAVVGIIGVSFGYIWLLPVIFSACLGWNSFGRIFLTILLIAPLGFCMGIPFPFGMRRLHTYMPQFVPWAYGINGCASVLSSLLATCLAIAWGFRTVIVCAGGLYLLAVGITWRNRKFVFSLKIS